MGVKDISTPLVKALRGYLEWTRKYGPPTGSRHTMPPEYDLRKVLSQIPESDPFFDLDLPIRMSALRILTEYERPGISIFTQNAYRSLLNGFQTLYVEKVQRRYAADRDKENAARQEHRVAVEVEWGDKALEDVLMGRNVLKVPGELSEARDALEGLLVHVLTAQGRTAPEARIESMNLVASFERLAYTKGVREGRAQAEGSDE